MIDRELGHMQIANETVRIVERAPESTDFFGLHHEARLTDITWCALLLEEHPQIIAYAVLERLPQDVAMLRWLVAPKHRNLGIGKLMARFATDLAIRYRQLEIQVVVAESNERAINILEAEDFERGTDEAGKLVMKKTLKWQ